MQINQRYSTDKRTDGLRDRRTDVTNAFELNQNVLKNVKHIILKKYPF